MNVHQAIREAAQRLSATSDTARLDAELLMAHALGTTRSDLLMRHMREPAPASFAALVERRSANEPVAHILGRQEFFGLDFAITEDTLIPRGDSETIVQAALDSAGPDARVLDMGTGSGALLLAFLSERPAAKGMGIDISPTALAVAQGNSEALGLANRAEFRVASWLDDGWTDDLGKFDLILCNPPYVEDDAELDPDVRNFEPASALFAGPEGLDDYRVVIPQLCKLLSPEGIAVLEIGWKQAGAVSEIASESGFQTELRQDLAGRPRVLILR